MKRLAVGSVLAHFVLGCGAAVNEQPSLEPDDPVANEFKNLSFTRESGCVPQTGSIIRTSRKGENTLKRLSYEVSADSEMILSAGSDGILLAPFACVLKER